MVHRKKLKMTIKISTDRLVNVQYVEGWNFSIFGKPKLKIICGKCKSQFDTRDYIPLKENGYYNTDITCCPYCGMWNRLGMKYN